MLAFAVMPVGGSPHRSWTVTGPDLLPLPPVGSYLRWCSARELSPGSVKAYAHALALFFRFLALREWNWRTVRLEQVARFIEWLRQPADNVIGLNEDVRRDLRPRARAQAPATVNKYAAALTGFYEFHPRTTATTPRLVAAATSCGYADQSHLTREFVRLAGCTPAAFIDNGGLSSAEAMPACEASAASHEV